MSNEKDARNARAEMELAERKAERSAAADQKLPRRFRLYDKIKDHVSLRTIDLVIVITSLLIIGLLIYGILTANQT